MKLKDLSKLIKKDRYQIFLFCSRVPLPYYFALHCWFVTNKKGVINRWEAGSFQNPRSKKSWGNVYQGLYNNNAVTGMNIYPFSSKKRYNSRIINYLEGGKESIANKMISFIETDAKKYPYKNEYKLLGPNSNTFVQWILEHFPKSKLKLPWNAIGKNHINKR